MTTRGWGRNTWSSGPWGEGDVITTPVGALVLSGVAPSVVVNDIITPGVGALALAGAAPLAIEGDIALPGVGALSLIHI